MAAARESGCGGRATARSRISGLPAVTLMSARPNTFCAATSLVLWRNGTDQSGESQDFCAGDRGLRNRHLCFPVSRLDGLHFHLTALTHQMSAPTASQATGVISFNAVLNRAVGTGICVLPQLFAECRPGPAPGLSA